jgi:hypothetical protein
MDDVKPGNARCPCGDQRCLLWLPPPPAKWNPAGDWCGECYPEAVARHRAAGKAGRLAALRQRTGTAA